MLLPKRVWKDIPGFEGIYQVSNTGQIRSLNYRGNAGKTKILKQHTDKDGYKRVNLYKDSKGKTYKVHRLVAQAFIPNPNNLPEVNHKDENKTNNVVWNLEFCTREYNNNYGSHNEKVSKAMKGIQRTQETKKKMSKAKKGKNKGKNNGMAKAVLMFTLDDEFIKRFNCTADANEYLCKPRNNVNISACARGEQETAWDYKWKYEKDYIKEQEQD